jgi:pseudouridine-5'-phosphate glycosidase
MTANTTGMPSTQKTTDSNFSTDPLNPRLVIRDDEPRVAFETTLLVHGVPTHAATEVADRLDNAVRAHDATPSLIGVLDGKAIAGMTRPELQRLHDERGQKLNLSNLPIALHRREAGATTVSSTLRIAAAAGIRVFATGAMGGVHRGYHTHLDISTDLTALAREPVALVSSGVKSLLDVNATRELLETLGVPVIGYRTSSFPAFYSRTSDAGVDTRCDTPEELAAMVDTCLKTTGRGVLVANPIPETEEIPEAEFAALREAAQDEASKSGVRGRDVTPFILGRLHEMSEGKTLRANIALAESNAGVAGQIARWLFEHRHDSHK